MAGNIDIATLTAKLALDAKSFNAGIDTATQKIGSITKDNAWSKIGESAKEIGKGFTIMGGAIVGAAGVATNAAVNFEDAFAGVKKTVNVQGTQEEINSFFADLEKGILEMSRRLPVTATEIAGVAESAGQLGIENDRILEFTETMIGLGSATNISAQEAAVALAQFANVTKMSQTDFDNLGSSIVELGNNMATDEKSIVEMATELANLKQQAGMSEADILGLSATFSSLGLEAAASGTSMQRLAMDITSAVATGNSKLAVFAETSGMTSEEFAKAWETDATSAFQAFIRGLGSKESYEQLDIFNALDIKQMREIDMLQRLAGNSELLDQAIAMSNQAWTENSALTEEVGKRNETTASQLQMVKNMCTEIAIEAGQALLPVVRDLLEQARPLLENISTYLKEHPDTVERIVKVGAALLGIGTAITTITNVVTAVGGFITTIKTLGSAITVLSGGGAAAGGIAGGAGLIGGLGTAITALSPILLAVGATVGVFALGWKNDWFGCQETFNKVYEETGSKMEAFRAVIKDIGHQIGEGIKNFFENTIKPFFSNLWNHVSDWLSNANSHMKEWLTNTLTSVGEFFIQLWNDVTKWFSNAISNVTKWLGDIKNKVTNKLSELGNHLKNWFSNAWSNVKDFFGNVGDTVSEKMTEFVTSIPEKVGEIWTKVTDRFNAIKEGVKTIFTNIKDTISGKMDEMHNKVEDTTDKMGGAFSKIGNWLSNAWEDISNWASNAWDKIKGVFDGMGSSSYSGYLASGGYASAGNAYIVGEEGPEVFVPSTNGYVYNHEDSMDMLGGEINIYIQGDVYDNQQSMEKKLKGAMLDVLREQMAYG